MQVTPLFIEMEIEERIRILTSAAQRPKREIEARVRMMADSESRSNGVVGRIGEYGELLDYVRRVRPDVDGFLGMCKNKGGEAAKLSDYLTRLIELYGKG
jgi:hypothetical protein